MNPLENDPVHNALQDFKWADDLQSVIDQGVEIVSEWEWTKKQERTIESIRNATTVNEVIKIVFFTYLSGARLRVLRS